MKILLICDTKGWAIDRLVRAEKEFNPQHEIKIIYIAPREALDKIDYFINKVKSFNPDIIEYNYFRTAGQLLEQDSVQEVVKNIPSILVHHNQRDKAIWQYDFNKLGIKAIVHHNDRGIKLHKEKFPQDEDILYKIQLATDLYEFQYREDEPKERFFGYAGRILSWKRLKSIIKVTKELEEKVMIMGRPDDITYQQEIEREVGFDNVNWSYWQCPDKARKDFYHNLFCYIGFSRDGTETGTLELLEAMASGVPVITTPTGIAEEIIEDGVNGLIVDFDNEEMLKEKIQLLIDDDNLRNNIRKAGWDTVKNYSHEKMAYQFNQLWHKTYQPDEELVSVIIPTTYDRKENIEQIIKSLENQSYKNIEIIVIWDEKEKEETALRSSLALKQIFTLDNGYNLAKSRNLGVCVASGSYIMLCDSRMLPDSDAVLSFVSGMNFSEEINKKETDMLWLFGDKGSQKQSFVENFSMVKRQHLISFGLFNERINEYGGMSQEIRTRWNKQGGTFFYCGEARAKELNSSKMTPEKRMSIFRMKLLLYKLFGDNKY